ncbi:DNA polymerase kappa subunit [Blastomyces gilchristii SLH14081]|uniref:DNA polymerase kappa n=1 Tax=Blastomyces gilchristii (strain SLH14081) TaxID=559298 RepID=A0A179V2D2_BLAGS|nr:DNA polymerase kappa subunit [Blastomyces gilchristii SLH14081]OAT13599.1 DNA polymerase kappa subunit [Blastomyces gilchristii SLH14081]
MASSENSGAGDDAQATETEETDETLKYRLLGPSLTKAGQSAVDQRKVSEIIYNVSRGSKFFTHEKSRNQLLTTKIELIISQKQKIEEHGLLLHTRRTDQYLAELELGRDLSQTVVHIDCDAFFAAVEELDRPELRELPMAVGKGVLTTCNYHARKYGCRSGMAGFIAKKLCPDLILIPQNYQKYTAKADEIRAILACYDPQFQSSSLDEAYLNITAYCSANEIEPEEAVRRLRSEVVEKTKVSISGGIAPNARLAKICSNWNKPNGQHYVPNERSAIMKFMSAIPLRNINGVGRVFERELDAIGIKYCRDIFTHRGLILPLFGEKCYRFLMQCYLGLGRTKIQPIEESERKSVGTERTFRDTGNVADLQEKLQLTALELEKDMLRTQFKGRTLVLKVKLHTFEVLSRQMLLPKAVYLSEDLYRYALPMLVKLYKETPNLKIRLMGLRCTNLVSMKKTDVNFFRGIQTSNGRPQSSSRIKSPEEEGLGILDGQDIHDQTRDPDSMIEDWEHSHVPYGSIAGSHTLNPLFKSDPTLEMWECPICMDPQQPDNSTFNRHLDFCLSKQTIREAVWGTLEEPRPPLTGKRKTDHPADTAAENVRKRPFFT